jgi:methyl-accepting chemotaxis protein
MGLIATRDLDTGREGYGLKSLQTRIVLFFSVLMLIAGSVLSYTVYTSSAELIKKSLGDQAKTIAAQAAGKIDTAAFRSMRADSDAYKQLRLLLNDMKETNGLKYLYTMTVREQNGQMEYVYAVDGAPLDAKEDVSEFGQVEKEPYAELARAFTEKQEQVGELTNDDSYGATVTAYVPIIDPATGDMLGVVGADFDATAVYERLQENSRYMVWVTGVILLAAVLATWLLARILLGPLKRLTAASRLVQAGDLTVRVETSRSDEIGVLSRAFQQMVGELSAMIRSIRDNAVRLNEATVQLNDHTERTSESGRRMTQSIREVASGASVQVQRSAETAKSVEEVSDGVQRIAESSSVAAEASLIAADQARLGNTRAERAMEQMTFIAETSESNVEDMKRLEQRTAEIGQIVVAIADISSQTNLLALNAAIEAARAGEHGRGFAVVADQVRKLASQAEESSRHISQLVDTIAEETSRVAGSIRAGSKEVLDGLEAVRQADAAFRAILSEVERVAAQVQDVSAVSEEIATGSEQVSAAIDEMAVISQEAAKHYRSAADYSETQQSSIEQLKRSTGSLQEMAAELNVTIRKFKV